MSTEPTEPEPNPLPHGKTREDELKRPYTDVPEYNEAIVEVLTAFGPDADFAKAAKYLRSMGPSRKGLTKLFYVKVLRDYSRNQQGRGIADATEDSIIDFEASMVHRGKPNKPITIAQKLTALRQFHVWEHRSDNPGDWKRITIPKLSEFRPLDPFALITPTEYKVFLDCCDNHQERALVALLYEAGLRSGEARSLVNNAVRPSADKTGLDVRLPPGDHRLKTGTRQILVVEAAGYLRAWMARHPKASEPNAPFFPSQTTGGHMSTDEVCQFFRRLQRRAKADHQVDKHVYAHLFRHTAATNKARRGWNIPKMNRYFGWSDKAKTAFRYTHLTDNDANDQVRRDFGLEVVAKDVGPIRHKCTCGMDNAVTARHCSDCGASLNPHLMSDHQKANQAINDQVDRHLEALIRFRQGLRARSTADPGAGEAAAPVASQGPPPADGAAAMAA